MFFRKIEVLEIKRIEVLEIKRLLDYVWPIYVTLSCPSCSLSQGVGNHEYV